MLVWLFFLHPTVLLLNTTDKIAVVGLGYVGLPLLFSIIKSNVSSNVVGYDTNSAHVSNLQSTSYLEEYIQGHCTDYSILQGNSLLISANPSILLDSSVYIVAVPTPLDEHHNPSLDCLTSASKTIGLSISNSPSLEGKDVIVIYESTVYPGVTENIASKIVQRYNSNPNIQISFGYSPERINPGDRVNNIRTIKKIISADCSTTLEWMDMFYSSISDAGTHRASSIQVAECAKALENTQRDINIALVNELAMLCSRLNIDTNEVIDAASTKWNFMDVRPGLVGGHCISVDPYYLAFAAESVGIHPRLIKAGRTVNDGMPGWIARRAVKKLVSLVGPGKIYNCLIMGMSYKENCADLRNSKSLELYHCVTSYGFHCDITDPLLDRPDSISMPLLTSLNTKTWHESGFCKYDIIILSVAHDEYKKLTVKDILLRCTDKYLLYDLKNVLPSTTKNLIKL